MIYIDFIFSWLLPWVFSAFMVMMGIFAIWQSVCGTVERNTRLALLVGGTAVILQCGHKLKELSNYEPSKQPAVKEVRV